MSREAEWLAVTGRMLRLVPRPPTAGDRAALESFAGEPAVRATYFMLDLPPEGGVELFLTHTLGRILQQLSRSTETRQVVLENQVRGRVLWAATLKARSAGDYQPNRFVCGEVAQDFDTPENQLLRYVLAALQGCLRAIPGIMRGGVCYLLGAAERPYEPSELRLGRMESALHLAGRNIRLRAASTPPAVSEFHLLRAETAQLKEYAQVAALYRRYRQVMLSATWDELAQISQRAIPLPAHRGAEGEPWIRLCAEMMRGGF